MIVTIEWDGIMADRSVPIQALIDQTFGSQEGFNAKIVRLLPLSGSESGAAVLRAIVKSPHSRVPYVLKCGQESLVIQEREAYERWNSTTTLWHGAPPHSPGRLPSVNQDGVTWSAILYRLAGNTGAAEDLTSLEDAVARYTASRPVTEETPRWNSVFRTLAGTLMSAYETSGPDLPAHKLLAPPSKQIRAILSSAGAVAEATGIDGAVDWAELSEALPRWESYLDSLHRDVRTTVCHGDLRGANVLLNGETYHPFLIDFGEVGFSSPIMDLARLEVDLLMRAGNLDDDTIPAVHEALFDRYTADDWQTGPVKVLHVIHSLRAAFERVIQQGLDVGRLRDEIRLFHACRVAAAMRMLRWADPLAASPQVRRHLMWFVLEGVRRVAGNSGQSTEDVGSLRPIPTTTGPLLRQVTKAGLAAVHGPDDWPARNADKTRLLESSEDLWVMAHSGWSFLAPEGALFVPMQERLARFRRTGKGRTRILLMSPYTEEGITRALQQRGEATELDQLRESRTFTRFARCLTDFRMLARTGDGAVSAAELRVCQFSVGCSVLLSGSEMFYEPYHVGLASLRDRTLQAFPEFRMQDKDSVRYVAAVEDQVRWLWERSMSEERFHELEPLLAEQATRSLVVLSEALGGPE